MRRGKQRRRNFAIRSGGRPKTAAIRLMSMLDRACAAA